MLLKLCSIGLLKLLILFFRFIPFSKNLKISNVGYKKKRILNEIAYD